MARRTSSTLCNLTVSSRYSSTTPNSFGRDAKTCGDGQPTANKRYVRTFLPPLGANSHSSGPRPSRSAPAKMSPLKRRPLARRCSRAARYRFFPSFRLLGRESNIQPGSWTPGSVCASYVRKWFVFCTLSKVTDVFALCFSRLAVSFASIPNRHGWPTKIRKCK